MCVSGHGQSEGNRVHVDHFDTYVHDALELMRQHKKEVRSLFLIIKSPKGRGYTWFISGCLTRIPLTNLRKACLYCASSINYYSRRLAQETRPSSYSGTVWEVSWLLCVCWRSPLCSPPAFSAPLVLGSANQCYFVSAKYSVWWWDERPWAQFVEERCFFENLHLVTM